MDASAHRIDRGTGVLERVWGASKISEPDAAVTSRHKRGNGRTSADAPDRTGSGGCAKGISNLVPSGAAVAIEVAPDSSVLQVDGGPKNGSKGNQLGLDAR